MGVDSVGRWIPWARVGKGHSVAVVIGCSISQMFRILVFFYIPSVSDSNAVPCVFQIPCVCSDYLHVTQKTVATSDYLHLLTFLHFPCVFYLCLTFSLLVPLLSLSLSPPLLPIRIPSVFPGRPPHARFPVNSVRSTDICGPLLIPPTARRGVFAA